MEYTQECFEYYGNWPKIPRGQCEYVKFKKVIWVEQLGGHFWPWKQWTVQLTFPFGGDRTRAGNWWFKCSMLVVEALKWGQLQASLPGLLMTQQWICPTAVTRSSYHFQAAVILPNVCMCSVTHYQSSLELFPLLISSLKLSHDYFTMIKELSTVWEENVLEGWSSKVLRSG